ncbi:MAG: hypothetical protein Fur0025_41850 [Oscillatoriaceae cyanobacterium]
MGKSRKLELESDERLNTQPPNLTDWDFYPGAIIITHRNLYKSIESVTYIYKKSWL